MSLYFLAVVLSQFSQVCIVLRVYGVILRLLAFHTFTHYFFKLKSLNVGCWMNTFRYLLAYLCVIVELNQQHLFDDVTIDQLMMIYSYMLGKSRIQKSESRKMLLYYVLGNMSHFLNGSGKAQIDDFRQPIL